MVNTIETPESDQAEGEEMYETHSLQLPSLNSHQRKLLFQTISQSYPFLSLEENAEDLKVCFYGKCMILLLLSNM